MAISQVSKGVYVISPNQVKKYRDSAAGEYTSVFTKERAQQFEMAQKQALLELELGSKQYAEEMKTYRDRLDALDARRKELEGLKVRVAEGRLDAKDAAAISALREAGSRQKTAADFAAKKAEVMTMSPGSTTTTTGGGGGAGTVGAPISSGAQTAAVTFEQTTRGQPISAKMQAMARETGTGGTIPTTGAADRVNARGSIADRAIASRAAELERAGQSPADARISAEGEALAALSSTDPVAAREVSDYLASKSAGAPATGGGGPTTRITTRPADITTKKRPTLGELPAAPTVEAPAVAGAEGIIGPEGLIAGSIAAIEAERARLARPSMAGFDYITRAREVAAGRFGPTPASSAFGQRNALDALLRADPSMRSAIMEQYARLAPPPAPAAAPPQVKPATGAEAPAVLPVVPPAGEPVTPPVTPPIATESTAATAPAASEIRPEAAALMTDAEKADFRRRLEERAELTSLLAAQKEAMAEVAGPSEAFRTAALTPMSPPRELPAPVRPQVVPPVGIVESLRTVRVPSGVTPPVTPPGVGRYTPGPVPVSVPMERPSAADAAPRTAAAAPEGFLDRLSRPLVANLGAQMAIREGEESAESTAAAKKTMADIKAAGAVEAFRGPKTGPGQTKEGYLLNRLEGAYTLAKRADKLSRVSASGPGKVAYDLYVANKAKGIPFGRTYEEITLTFAGDGPSMEKAHEAALALDIKDRDTAPGGK